MSGPPPPPPPPPMPGFGGGPPPPPPMPGGNSLPARPPASAAKGRGALLSDIGKGARLRSVQTNDRSAPIVVTKADPGAAPIPGAPPIPGMRPPTGLAPPAPSANRNRSNSDAGSGAGAGAVSAESAPQLSGLFAGGMPRLKKTRGGVETGAGEQQGSHSDPESSKPLAPRPPHAAAPPLPPGAAPAIPRVNALRPTIASTDSAPAVPSPLAHLKKPPPRPAPKPGLSNIGLGKPPPPPPMGRKASGQPLLPPPIPPITSSPSLAPPPPPPPSTQSPSSASPSIAPPPPPPPPASSSPQPPSAPRPPPMAAPSISPPIRSSPRPTSAAPPPPLSSVQSMPPAQAAAIQAIGKSGTHSGRPDSSPSPSSFSGYGPQVMPARTQTQTSVNLAPSSYTLSSAAVSSYTLTNGAANGGGSGHVQIQDSRWKFQDESQLPPPRQFTGVPKRYRAGRGSTVPLDLSSLG